MKKVLVSAAATAAAAAMATSVGVGSSAADSGRTIRLLDRRTGEQVLDLDQSGGPTPGDSTVFTSDELDRDGRKVGVGNGRITATFGHVLIEATVTLSGRGQITVAGADDLDPSSGRLAVTGGTGDFREARGELRFETLESGDTRLRFRLDD